MRKQLTILLITIGLFQLTISCNSDVFFEESQPQGAKIRNKIPKKLWGKYNKIGENDVITVSKKMIVVSPLETRGKFDTLFAVTDSSFITKYKEYYYFNFFISNDSWLISPMSFKNDTIIIWNDVIANKELKVKSFIREVVKIDTNNQKEEKIYFAKPTKKELHELHQMDVFRSPDKYLKIE